MVVLLETTCSNYRNYNSLLNRTREKTSPRPSPVPEGRGGREGEEEGRVGEREEGERASFSYHRQEKNSP